MRDGHQVVVQNRSPGPVAELAKDGAEPAATIEELVEKLEGPRIVWVMLPDGQVTENAITRLGEYVRRVSISVLVG